MNRNLSLLVFALAGCSRGNERQDATRSVAAFEAVYPVFIHPRCLNCHPAGDVPLVGEDSHPHLQNVKRGPDGRGLFALRCTNCHQEKNLFGERLPPGHPGWRLPPKETPMVFEGRTPRELARQLKDPKENGGKSLRQLLAHIEEDPLVVTSWTRGDGRSAPRQSHEDFARRFRDWIETGAAEPE